jgi:hypothetical protein
MGCSAYFLHLVNAQGKHQLRLVEDSLGVDTSNANGDGNGCL